jgi:two-component system, response regulator FlrC
VLQAQETQTPQDFLTSESGLLLGTVENEGTAWPSAFVGRTLAEVERHLILDTLAHCLGNRTHAAKILGISIRTLRNKLNDYTGLGIAVPEPGGKAAAAQA